MCATCIVGGNLNRSIEMGETKGDRPVPDDAGSEGDSRVDERIAGFQAKLGGDDTAERIVRAGILHGSAFAVEDDAHYELLETVASEFNLDSNRDVFLVGSAKLGFSIAPHKRYKPFNDESDLDLAIVSSELFKRVWHEVDEYRSINGEWSRTRMFADYLSRGWIRPDMLPSSSTFAFSNDWWNFFRSVQNRRIGGGFKIRAGIYHDTDFLVRYQQRAVSACRDVVRMGSVDEHVGDE